MCCSFFFQVSEQQQDQRVRDGGSGQPGLHSSGPETEPQPDKPSPCESLPAPKADSAVSTRSAQI